MMLLFDDGKLSKQLRAYSATLCQLGQCLLCRLHQSLRQLSSAMLRFFLETTTDAKGKERKKYRYKDMMTTYEKFKSTPEASQYLKADITLEQLDARAAKMSDNDAALVLNNARKSCFKDIAVAMKKQA